MTNVKPRLNSVRKCDETNRGRDKLTEIFWLEMQRETAQNHNSGHTRALGCEEAEEACRPVSYRRIGRNRILEVER